MERIYHTWDKWECYPAGFYENRAANITDEEAFEAYRAFLADLSQFESALACVIEEWVYSCEHYLSNDRMNRVAWLGQASACYALGLPSRYRGGYNRLTEDEKNAADELALRYMNIWRVRNGHPELTPEEAASRTEMDLY
jgi:hypothetical protein